MQYQPTLEFARGQDEADPLRKYRDRFHFPSLDTPELVYFTGHSLGLQPKIAVDRLNSMPTDMERVDAIFDRITTETDQVFSMLKKGMIEEASLKTVEENIARDYILQTFDEIRIEAHDTSIRSARHFAAMCAQAAEHLPEGHQKNVAKCVAELFDQFARRLDAQVMRQAPAVATSKDSRKDADVRALLENSA